MTSEKAGDGEIAGKCLVFMVNALNGHFKLPVAHFFVNSMKEKVEGLFNYYCLKIDRLCFPF